MLAVRLRRDGGQDAEDNIVHNIIGKIKLRLENSVISSEKSMLK